MKPKEGDTQASAKEAGNKPILSAALPFRCLPTWKLALANFSFCQSNGPMVIPWQ